MRICGLSGGVDSAVVAVLLHRAIGDRLTCIFVDHGLLRQARRPRWWRRFSARSMGMRLNAARTLPASSSPTWPGRSIRRKSVRIGARFIRTFEAAEAEAASAVDGGYARDPAQGTLYPGM